MSRQDTDELREYVGDMFRMVWRDAEDGRADKLTDINSATEMVMRRVETDRKKHELQAKMYALIDFYDENYEVIDQHSGLLNSVASDIGVYREELEKL